MPPVALLPLAVTVLTVKVVVPPVALLPYCAQYNVYNYAAV